MSFWDVLIGPQMMMFYEAMGPTILIGMIIIHLVIRNS